MAPGHEKMLKVKKELTPSTLPLSNHYLPLREDKCSTLGMVFYLLVQRWSNTKKIAIFLTLQENQTNFPHFKAIFKKNISIQKNIKTYFLHFTAISKQFFSTSQQNQNHFFQFTGILKPFPHLTGIFNHFPPPPRNIKTISLSYRNIWPLFKLTGILSHFPH